MAQDYSTFIPPLHQILIQHCLNEYRAYRSLDEQGKPAFNVITNGINLQALQYINAPRIFLQGAHLAGANLTYANLEHANLENAYLENANLKNAYLGDAELINADLEYANLIGADLKGANFHGADLKGAKLPIETIFKAMNLDCAKDIDRALFYYENKRITNIAFDKESDPYYTPETPAQDKDNNTEFTQAANSEENKKEDTISFANIADKLVENKSIPKLSPQHDQAAAQAATLDNDEVK